ncbi:MAG: hypothetical protein LBF77_11190 [Spirochaetaceae bacterium]|nr:hypothetical protein [Spirochaetaceae bacterium]
MYGIGKESQVIATKKDEPEQNPVTWHTAFRDVIRLTLYPYRHSLDFIFEHPLNSEPLRIDAVIIKKKPGVVIDNPIGAIFREVNIVEYKSPGVRLSVKDFHKVGAYALLYSVQNGVETTDMSISFVVEAYPRKLVEYLRKVYGFRVKERWPGVCYVEGHQFVVQIIVSKGLGDGDGGIWLKELRGGLNGERIWEIIKMVEKMPEGAPLSAYIHVLLRANPRGFKEIMSMSDISFEEVIEECGLAAKWRAEGQEEGREEGREKGREEGREEMVKRLQKHGMDPKQISEYVELPLGTVFRYLKAE